MQISIPENAGRLVHPTGQHKGFFYEVEDRGQVDTQWGPKNKLWFKIESTTAFIKEGSKAGEPYQIWMSCNVTNDPRGNLRKYRRTVLGRDLDEAEANASNFDPEEEFIGKRIGYTVIHSPNQNPAEPPWANIDNFWTDDDGQNEADTTGSTKDIKDKAQAVSGSSFNSKEELVSEIRRCEESLRFPPENVNDAAWSSDALVSFRDKHLSSGMKSPDDELEAYRKLLNNEMKLMGVDQLPF